MIVENGKRKIKYCIELEVEVDENLSEEEVDKVIEKLAEGKDYMWCDGDENLFEME